MVNCRLDTTERDEIDAIALVVAEVIADDLTRRRHDIFTADAP